MTIKKLILELTKLEGKKKQITIAQMSEIVGLLAELVFKSPKLLERLYQHGARRVKKTKPLQE